MEDWKNKDLLKVSPFYNILIDFRQRTKVKKLTNVDLLNELPFYNGLYVKQTSEAFKKYAKSFHIEKIDRKDPLVQLQVSKQCTKDLFIVLLCDMKGFKYQITINIKLRKQKINIKVEYANVYFNSVAKVVINRSFDWIIDKSFDEILHRINNWINEGSGWVIDLINSQYLNVSAYAPFLGGTFIELCDKLKNPKNGLINLRNNDI